MFFLVTHTWTAPNDQAASKKLRQLMTDSHYGRIGKPWPKLITLWQNPRTREVHACWESPNRRDLEKVFARERVLRTEITHVRQLYPPHVQCYNAMEIRPDPDWAPGAT